MGNYKTKVFNKQACSYPIVNANEILKYISDYHCQEYLLEQDIKKSQIALIETLSKNCIKIPFLITTVCRNYSTGCSF